MGQRRQKKVEGDGRGKTSKHAGDKDREEITRHTTATVEGAGISAALAIHGRLGLGALDFHLHTSGTLFLVSFAQPRGCVIQVVPAYHQT